MRYRRIGEIEVSEIGLDCPEAARLEGPAFTTLAGKALTHGVNFMRAGEPQETAALGDTLELLGAREKSVVAAGIGEFFAAYARHQMPLAEFLEHELQDQLSRIKAGYIDCFVIDLGAGRSVDLEGVLGEEVHSGSASTVESRTYEGGVFLHETISDCMKLLDDFKKDGRVRLSGLAGENISVVKRVLVKNGGFDCVFAPYNYAFRAAADELIPIALESGAAFVASKPLWWGIRGIPVTVLADSPFPTERARVAADSRVLAKAACKWPLTESGVTSVMIQAETVPLIDAIVEAADEDRWTRADEETLRPVAQKAAYENGALLILSAMNSPDADLRARGWAACVRRGLPESGYYPLAPAEERSEALETIASAIIRDEPQPDESLEELL